MFACDVFLSFIFFVLFSLFLFLFWLDLRKYEVTSSVVRTETQEENISNFKQILAFFQQHVLLLLIVVNWMQISEN